MQTTSQERLDLFRTTTRAAPTTTPATRRKRTQIPPRPERILIVDDEPLMTEMIRDHLSFEGFRATTTNDSSEVMDLIEADHYDLMLLDVGMPDPNGLIVLQQVQGEHPFLPVIMLTAFTDADTASQAMRDGASDYIVKPYQEAQLVSRIERALERGQLLRERAQAHDLLEQRIAEQTRMLRVQSKQLSVMLDRVLLTYQATVKALEAALDVRDQSAPGHCRRVAKLAVQLGNHMGLRLDDLIALEHGALLHDIGKLGVPDGVLMKPGPLDEDEWVTMRQHPEIGCEVVGHIDFLQNALPIIRHHHERYDGAGYPDGLAGAQIPLLARIFAVIDAFDAQTHQRPYNTVLDLEQVLAKLQEASGTQFDPAIVDAFVAMIREEEK
ncbi:MAG TPA: HD domain-containing phosphohydrolase [Anaerolineae bacterium]|nr:HD domain-containing phosphohydrolase [Anaerolineae bacterium]